MSLYHKDKDLAAELLTMLGTEMASTALLEMASIDVNSVGSVLARLGGAVAGEIIVHVSKMNETEIGIMDDDGVSNIKCRSGKQTAAAMLSAAAKTEDGGRVVRATYTAGGAEIFQVRFCRP